MEVRGAFHRKLEAIQSDLIAMGKLVGEATLRSIEALKARDVELAHKIVADDARVNQMRWDIEERCVQLIATQQPMASDLRVIVAVLQLIGEIERIGDHAVGNARVVIMIGNEPPLKPLIDIPRMAEFATDMLRRALDAFILRDAETALKIVGEDDQVDQLYDQVFRELLVYMMEDARTITRATRLIWVAHNLERSADRVTNICERTIFLITGKMQELAVSKY